TDSFLRQKARQLPTDAPGIIVIEVSGAVGGMAAAWETAILRRLHPGQHTRVSAVVLLESGICPLDGGEAWAHRAKVIRNPNAALNAPVWALAPFELLADHPWHAFGA